VLAFSTQVCGFKPGRSLRNFRAKNILSTSSFGGEVKPSVSCHRFAACKRSLNLRGSRNSGKITTGHLSRPQFHLSLLGSLASLRTEAQKRKTICSVDAAGCSINTLLFLGLKETSFRKHLRVVLRRQFTKYCLHLEALSLSINYIFT